MVSYLAENRKIAHLKIFLSNKLDFRAFGIVVFDQLFGGGNRIAAIGICAEGVDEQDSGCSHQSETFDARTVWSTRSPIVTPLSDGVGFDARAPAHGVGIDKDGRHGEAFAVE